MLEESQRARVWSAGASVLATAILFACTEPGVGPIAEPPEPAEVLIINANVTNVGADSALVTARLRNLGRSGTAKLQAWGSHVSRDSADVLLGETAPTELRANAFPQLSWKVPGGTPVSTSGVQYVTALTRDQESGMFRQTSRWNLR